MDIIPLGLSAFKLKGKKASVICDPYDVETVGLKAIKNATADIVTISHDHPDHNNASLITPATDGREVVVFNGPGEYEAAGVEITGIATYHDGKNGAERGKNTIYSIIIDGITAVHCGDLGHKLTDEQAEIIENVDILLIPIGGTYTIDANVAAQVIAQLEPSIVVPMHYHRAQLNQKVFGTIAPVSTFLKEMGLETVVAQPKLTTTKDKLPSELQVVVLE